MQLTPNRVVAVLAPLIFAPLAGTIAALLAEHFPGVEVDPGDIEAVFISGALIGLAPALQWLHGWQKHEARKAGFAHELAMASVGVEAQVASADATVAGVAAGADAAVAGVEAVTGDQPAAAEDEDALDLEDDELDDDEPDLDADLDEEEDLDALADELDDEADLLGDEDLDAEPAAAREG